MEKRAGPVTKRSKKIVAKLNEEESKYYRIKTLSFNGARHLVYLNLSYIIELEDKPYKNKEEIRDQPNLDKSWPFDVRKITDGLNDLQIMNKIKDELLDRDADETKDSNKDLGVYPSKNPVESEIRNIPNELCDDIEQSLIRQFAHKKLNPNQRKVFKDLIDSKMHSLIEISRKFYISKSVLYSIKNEKIYSNKAANLNNEYNYKSIV